MALRGFSRLRVCACACAWVRSGTLWVVSGTLDGLGQGLGLSGSLGGSGDCLGLSGDRDGQQDSGTVWAGSGTTGQQED